MLLKFRFHLSTFIFIAISLSTHIQAQQAGTKGDIHSIDFDNFTYDVRDDCGDVFNKKKISVRNGCFGDSYWQFCAGNIFEWSPVVYGDLTGDGRDEAIVMTACGGMHSVSEPYVFTMKDGKPSLLTKLEVGNRAMGGYKKITVMRGLLITERLYGRGACCPEYEVTQSYKWNGRDFIKVGKEKRKKVD